MQTRQKWLHPKQNLKDFGVVILKNNELPRNQWQLARIEDVFPDNYGLVRKVRIEVGDCAWDKNRKRIHALHCLESDHKLILLVAEEESEEDKDD